MLGRQVKTKDIQDKNLQKIVTPTRQKEIDDRLKQFGIKGPDYLRGMMDNDMKDVDIGFLE